MGWRHKWKIGTVSGVREEPPPPDHQVAKIEVQANARQTGLSTWAERVIGLTPRAGPSGGTVYYLPPGLFRARS